MPQLSVTKIHLKITYLEFHSNFPGANELRLCMYIDSHALSLPTVINPMYPNHMHTSYSLLWYFCEGVPAYPDMHWFNSGSCAFHYSYVIMGKIASQITSLTIVYSTVYSGTDQRKHERCALLAFVRGIHQWPVNSPHKGPEMWKMFAFDDIIMSLFFLFLFL